MNSFKKYLKVISKYKKIVCSLLNSQYCSVLVDDYPQPVNVVNARKSSSEVCLLTIYDSIKMVVEPIQYDLGADFADCGQATYSSPIIANL